MAIYHLSGSVISRSQGRSAVACSAYRSAEKLLDERYEKTHDYKNKKDVAFSEILLPKNAPEWMKDRETLWNAVEAGEKRKDAQLAREIQISLPRELTKEQNIELAREYVQKEFVDQGMVADWALHLDKTPSGEDQPHIHVMLTMREINEEGFGQKVREWNNKENLLLWREDWAEVANRHLALNGHDIQIDHRSNLERGIDLEPQHKIGASVARDHMARLEDHNRIAFENGEKIHSDPTVALNALTRQQSTFTHQDLARFVNRHTVDAEQFDRVYEKVKSSDQVISLGLDDRGRERFTTRDMLTLEKRMLEHGNILIDRPSHEASENARQQGIISRELTVEQKNAYEHLLSSGDLKCVVGYAGTGKSYLLGAAKEAWESEGYRVHGVTLSGIAAENLEGSSGIESRTLASRLYYWDKGEQLLTRKDILVIDEAGMIGSRQMERLLDEAQKNNAKVVLIGDPQQLQAIEAGAAFRAVSERSGYVELTEVRRQQHEWQREATKEFANGKTAEALDRYQSHSHVHEFETQAMAKKSVVEMWNDVRINDSDKTQIMLAYTRKDVQELNEMARDMRRELGELGKDHTLQTKNGAKSFAENDRVYFLQKDLKLDVNNGSLGTIEKIEGNQITVRLDRENSRENLQNINGAQRVTFDLNKYNYIDYGYAATIHKAQGVTVDRTYVLTSKYMDSHATYVGMSRHRESADLFWSREEFSNIRDLSKSLNRDRSKDVTLDYGEIRQGFAEHRGIEVSRKLSKELQQNIHQKETKEKNVRRDIYQELGFDANEAKRYSLDDLRKQQSQKQKDMREFDDFKKSFEKQNPALAKALANEMRPEAEKRAIEVKEKIQNLSKQLEQNPRDYAAKRELNNLVGKVSKDKAVMRHLKEREPEIDRQVKLLEKERSRELSRGLSR